MISSFGWRRCCLFCWEPPSRSGTAASGDTVSPQWQRRMGERFSIVRSFLLRPVIQNALGPEVTLIDSGAECVRDISVLLNYFEINRGRDLGEQQHTFYTTGDVEPFTQLAQTWLEEAVRVEHIDL